MSNYDFGYLYIYISSNIYLLSKKYISLFLHMIDKKHLKSYFEQSVDLSAACDEREPRSALLACIRQSYPTYPTYPVFVGFSRRLPRITPRPGSYEMSRHDTLTAFPRKARQILKRVPICRQRDSLANAAKATPTLCIFNTEYTRCSTTLYRSFEILKQFKDEIVIEHY